MILVLGSINADLFFTVDHLPTPGETVLTPSVTLRPGGKGANQAAAAARAGAETRFLGCVGDDAVADTVLGALVESGCDVAGVTRRHGATGTAVVMVEASGENQIVVARGANGFVTADLLPAGMGAGTTLICQMELPPVETERALVAAKGSGVRTVLNLAPAKPIADRALAVVDVLVVNEIEAVALASGAGTPLSLARMLANRHNLTCVVTIGAQGAVAVEPNSTAWRVGALAVEVVDTVGAGDAFVGVLAAALDSGADLPAALHRASVAASLACMAEGAMTGLPNADAIKSRQPDLAPATRM